MIVEAKLSAREALELLEISSKDASDANLLKKAYYKAAKTAHPDAGGSDEEMKVINEAYDLLQASGGGAGGGRMSREDWDKIYKEYQDLGAAILGQLKSKFEAQPYVDYLTDILGEPVSAKIKWSDPAAERSPSYVNLNATFSNADGTTYFQFSASAYLHDIKNSTTLKGGDSDYKLGIQVDAYFNRRKQPISNERWSTKENHALLSDPTILFPRAKIDKLIKRGKVTRFTRKDFIRALASELGGHSTGGDWYYIPMGEGFKLAMVRSVIMKTAAYSLNGIYQGNKRVATPAYQYFPEDESTIDYFKLMQKNSAGMTDAKAINDEVNAIIAEIKSADATDK